MRLKRYLLEEANPRANKFNNDIRDVELDRAGFRNLKPGDADALMLGMEKTHASTFEKIIEVLERDCQKFIREMNNADMLVWRGTTGPMTSKRSFEDDIRKKYSHTDDSGDGQYGRRPKAYPSSGHAIFNILSKQLYGWRFRDGIMTTSDYDHARQFGAPFIFFPIGDYQYLWHPRVHDFNEYEIPVNGRALKEFDEADFGGLPDNVWRWFKMYDKTHDDAYAGAWSYFQKHPDEVERITKLLKLDKFMLEYKSDKLQLGIEKEREIVFNCKEYYLIHNFWSQKIVDYLHG
jgi:hypothetical protein